MPTYEFTDPRSGLTLEVSGDGVPSEHELDAMFARAQGDNRGGQYVRDAITNIPGDAVAQARGAVDLVRTLAGATGEVGGAIGGRIREMAGIEPGYPAGTPNVDRLAATVPAIIDHYRGYLDPNERALMVRDHPVGLALDVAGATGAARGAVSGGRVAVPAVFHAGRDVIAAHPEAVAAAAGAAEGYATHGWPGAAIGALGLPLSVKAAAKMLAQAVAKGAASDAVPGVVADVPAPKMPTQPTAAAPPASAPAPAAPKPMIPAVIAKPRVRVPAEGVPSDRALAVLVREADRGNGSMTGPMSEAEERAIAEQLHKELAALDMAYRRHIGQ
jgi:hypothetical protein